jgi:dipeptidyl-peptidase 4
LRKLGLLVLLAFPAIAQKKPVTLEALQDSPRRGDASGAPVWAPDGKSFVFRQGRNLVIFDPATKRTRDLVATDAMDQAAVKIPPGPADWQNRRVRDTPLQWSPSGEDLLYLSGGDLFLIHVATGKWDQLTKSPVFEHDPKISPDGTMISFRRDWDLYTLDLASRKEKRLTADGSESLRNGGLDWVYPEELEIGTAHWWSPDSKSIAFLQFDVSREPLLPKVDMLGLNARYEPERYPQAGGPNADVHLGVVPVAGGTPKWLEIGDTRFSYLISRAGWMPDSMSVYVVRTNRVQNHLDLLSISVESRAQSTIFSEDDKYWIDVHGDVRFLNDGKRFLWLSERDGFNHLYLYSIDGHAMKQLTSGAWEIRSLAGVDETGQRAFLVSNEVSPLETHLYSVRLDGSDKRRLDTEAGSHTVSMGPGGRYSLDTYSSLTSPPRTVLRGADGAELSVFREPDRKQTEEYEVLPTEIVTFKGKDGTLFYGRLITPSGFQPGKKYPAIVTVYGGPALQAPRNLWEGLTMDQVYAHKGYVVWQMSNRGEFGRGHAFASAVYHKLGTQELADQREGIEHLISMGFVDAQRIGMHGWSYGGFMTLYIALNAPDLIRCGVAGALISDWRNYDTIYTERTMGLPKDNQEGFDGTALLTKAKNLKARLMIVHNFEDDNVPFQNALQIMDALQQAGKQFDFMLYPQKTHGVTGVYARQMDASMLDFFERNLK